MYTAEARLENQKLRQGTQSGRWTRKSGQGDSKKNKKNKKKKQKSNMGNPRKIKLWRGASEGGGGGGGGGKPSTAFHIKSKSKRMTSDSFGVEEKSIKVLISEDTILTELSLFPPGIILGWRKVSRCARNPAWSRRIRGRIAELEKEALLEKKVRNWEKVRSLQ